MTRAPWQAMMIPRACISRRPIESGRMKLPIVLLLAVILSSCANEYDTDSGPKMKQEAHTNAMGQTIYTYKPVDGQ